MAISHDLWLKERLPYAGLERLDSVLWGGEDKADLASHSGQVAKLLYQIRQSDNFNHALEPLSYHDLTQELGNQGFVYENYDALVIERNKLERKAKANAYGHARCGRYC